MRGLYQEDTVITTWLTWHLTRLKFTDSILKTLNAKPEHRHYHLLVERLRVDPVLYPC